MAQLTVVFVVFCFQLAAFTEPPCVIELVCAECIPDNMPLVLSHRAAAGAVRVPDGDTVRLSCGAGKFLAYPQHSDLRATCAAGRYRVLHDAALRHLLELSCQENLFEDVLHQVDGCDPPLQGRAYRAQGVGHLATACFDADRAAPLRLRMTAARGNLLPLPAHAHHDGPLSLLGNFNHMFDAKTRHDAEKLYSDDVRMNRRLHELFRFEHYTFAGQTLTSAKLLSAHYFEDQNMRVTDFVSNRVAVWASVAGGNLRLLQRDVAQALHASARAGVRVDVHAGTHGVGTLRTGRARAELFLQAGGRFPVPRYVWTVLHAPELNRAVALVVLNDPFVAVSEIREAVFCASECSRLGYLQRLRAHRNYECPLYGLVFCCALDEFAAAVGEWPRAGLHVPAGDAGMLTDLSLGNDTSSF